MPVLIVLVAAALCVVGVLRAFATPVTPPEVGSVPDAVAVAQPIGSGRPGSGKVGPGQSDADQAPGEDPVAGGAPPPAGSGVVPAQGGPGVPSTRSGRGGPAGQGTSRTPKAPNAGRAARPLPVGRVVPVALTLQGRASAPVIPEGVTGGALDIPKSVATLGWWVGGADLADTAGSIVIAGHVDSAAQGRGYFAVLRDLSPGERITVRGSDGSVRNFVVTGRRNYLKAAGLPRSLFDQAVQNRLVLITCTGPFDRVARSYLDNLVVYAVPVR